MNCPYEIIYEERIKGNVQAYRRRYKACNAPYGSSGWCELHKASYELLEAAKAAGYPDMVIATIQGQPVYVVSRGKLNWEGYAKRHQAGRHKELMKKLATLEREAA